MAQLERKLTLYGLTMIAIGSCIGAGIFVTPYEVVGTLPRAGWVLIIWALGGLVALTGALTFAELGAMFPRAGGVYAFLREGYGDATGFLYGWVTLLVINTGALAALAVTFAEYFTFFVPLEQTGKLLLAAAVIAGLTAWNVRGVSTSQTLANVFTGLKLLAILAIILVAFLYYDPDRLAPDFSLSWNEPRSLGAAMLTALVGVFFSFGGWHHATYVAGEAIEPQRTVPRAMLLGVLVVTVTYLLVNLAYFLLLPVPGIIQSARVAGDAVGAVISGGGRWVAVAIGLSVFGTIAIYTMSAPRIYFAMARDGVFFEQLARLHPRFHTPVAAMVLQAGWAILLLLFWGTFENLITYVTFMDIAFMALAGITVFVFRRRLPTIERPYRVWGYPVVPLVYIGITSAFVVNTLIQRPVQAVAGLIVVAVGLALYARLRKRDPAFNGNALARRSTTAREGADDTDDAEERGF